MLDEAQPTKETYSFITSGWNAVPRPPLAVPTLTQKLPLRKKSPYDRKAAGPFHPNPYHMLCYLRGDPERPDILQNLPKIRLRGTAHSSICIQEGQPNLSFRRFNRLTTSKSR